MAIDTFSKRVAATTLYAQAKAVVPVGTTDRMAASWVYSGNEADQFTDFPNYDGAGTINIYGRNYTALSLEKLLQFIPFSSYEPYFTFHKKKQ